jgi:hypothetical protein
MLMLSLILSTTLSPSEVIICTLLPAPEPLSLVPDPLLLPLILCKMLSSRVAEAREGKKTVSQPLLIFEISLTRGRSTLGQIQLSYRRRAIRLYPHSSPKGQTTSSFSETSMVISTMLLWEKYWREPAKMRRGHQMRALAPHYSLPLPRTNLPLPKHHSPRFQYAQTPNAIALHPQDLQDIEIWSFLIQDFLILRLDDVIVAQSTARKMSRFKLLDTLLLPPKLHLATQF